MMEILLARTRIKKATEEIYIAHASKFKFFKSTKFWYKSRDQVYKFENRK